MQYRPKRPRAKKRPGSKPVSVAERLRRGTEGKAVAKVFADIEKFMVCVPAGTKPVISVQLEFGDVPYNSSPISNRLKDFLFSGLTYYGIRSSDVSLVRTIPSQSHPSHPSHPIYGYAKRQRPQTKRPATPKA